MTRPRARVLATAVAALAASCNLVDLSARINQTPCADQSDCALLNDLAIEPSFRECQPFVCNERHFCEPEQLDKDHDGYSPMKCAKTPQEIDCNDFDSNTHPAAAEVCDDADNDCDKHIDEDSLPIEQTVAVTFNGRTPISDLSSASDDSRVALAYVIDADNPSLAANVISYQEISQQDVTALHVSSAADAVRAANASVALLPGPVPLVGAYITLDPARLIVATVQRGSTLSTNRITQFGLSCQSGEDCAANSDAMRAPVAPIPTPATTRPTLASGMAGVLAAYVREAAASDDMCTANGVPETRPILGNLIVSTAFSTSETTKLAVTLGDTAENASPALIAVPGSTTNGRPYGWLLAYPNARGEILLVQISRDDRNVHVSEPLLTLSSASGPLHAPRLADGVRATDHVAIGLVALQGCGESSKVVMAGLDLTLGSLGGVALRIENKLRQVGGGSNERAPAIAYHPTRRSWGVAYRDDAGVKARIVEATGAVLGAEPYLLVEGGGDQPAQSVAIAPLTPNGWFSVLAYDEAEGGQIVKSDLPACARP